MNLIFIYGPPAAGKLTVARELAGLTDYKIYDNHAFMTPIAELFPYNDPVLTKIRSKLGERIRLDVFGEAADAGVNLITTAARAGKKDFAFFRQVVSHIEDRGGKVLFVQLKPSKEVLFERVKASSRQGIKVNNHQRLQEILVSNPELFNTFPDVEHLVIDNSNRSPSEISQVILEYYRLNKA